MSKPRSEKRQRNFRKTFRMNEKELTAFLENCQAANLSDADLFRVRCCGKKPLRKRRIHRIDEKALASALGHLMRVANNVNQIAHALNIAKSKPDAAATAEVLSRNQKKIGEMHAAILESRDLITKSLLNHDLES